MRGDEVPDGYKGVMCLRCRDVLALPRDVAMSEQHQACTEHHLWLCVNPTPHAARMRRIAREG